MEVIDKYSSVHFIVGFIVYFLNINITILFALSTIYEIYENSRNGCCMSKTIGEKFSFSAGDPETLINSVGDIVCVLLGWICAYYIDKKIMNKTHDSN